ncbi:MAG TPA: ABC transporter ATP-binding protein [Ilumatobacter sp.]|nr:ABC transporter ATP-binding protein [Ilumatobacter sp.]
MVLDVVNLSKAYGHGERSTLAIESLTFSVRAGEFVCIVGPSGCGKTTLLRSLSGLVKPSGGQALIHGSPVDGPPEAMALVFQDYSRSLFPWMTVARNVAFPLRRKRMPKAERDAAVAESLAAVGLADAAERYPWQLSGGMQQRVAIARALAYKPEILLMDEPFASVDAQTRSDLEDLLLSVWEAVDVTVVFVTHDIDEAVYLGDRVVVLSPSPCTVDRIVTVDLPRPRDQLTTKSLPRYVDLRTEVFSAIVKRPAPDG